MSENTTSEKRNIGIGIKNSIEKNTKFMYYDGIEYKPSQDVKETRLESIEFKVAQGTYFELGDFFLLREVHNLGVTNVGTLLKRLTIKIRNNPDKAYPVHDYHSLMNRLRFLVRQGLLFSYEFFDSYKRSMFVFCCNAYGWRVYKNKLCAPDLYDKNIIFKAEAEVFKKLACNAVAHAFASSPICSSIMINENAVYGENKRINLFAKVTMEDERKTTLIVEPAYFNIDHRILNDEENKSQLLSRLTQIEDYINFVGKERNTKLILCVENYLGLSKLLDVLKTKDIQFYTQNCYFTSENVLFESNDELSRSFLRLALKNDTYTFAAAKESWLS